jgi:probable addiction module antidote protein
MDKPKLDMEKINKITRSHDDFMQEQLQDEEFQKMYLTGSLEDYLEDGDFRPFFRALERVVKARCSVSKFCKDADISRNNLYALVRGDRKPQLETVLKMLNNLGFSLKVA